MAFEMAMCSITRMMATAGSSGKIALISPESGCGTLAS